MNEKLRVVFMGTPPPAALALEKLAAEHEVVGVYSQPDRAVGRSSELRASAVKEKAQALGLEVFQPEKLTLPGEFDRLEELRPDLIAVVAYGQILKSEVLELPRFGCLNVHYSLLPRWRGAAPVQWSLLAGDEEVGVTIIRIVEALDAGPILAQTRTPVKKEETASQLFERLSLLGAELLAETVKLRSRGEIEEKPQEPAQVTLAPKLTKEMENLDPRKSAVELERQVRALQGWPGTSVQVRGMGRLKIRQARLREGAPQAKVGQIFEHAGMVLLACADGALELLRLQWDGKKPQDCVSFANGLKGRGVSLPLETHERKKEGVNRP